MKLFPLIQLLQVIIVENLIGSNKGYPVTSVPIPMAPLFTKANDAAQPEGDAEASHRSSRLPPTTLGLEPLASAASGPVLGLSRSSVRVQYAGGALL